MSPFGPRAAARPFDRLISRVITRWRDEAAILHRRGADEQAAVLESCAVELEHEGRLFSLEGLTLGQAAEESGFSYSALEKMVRSGRIANVGLPGQPRLRRGDLPKKPGGVGEPRGDEPDLADRVLAASSIVS